MEEEKKMMRLKMRWREDGEKDKNSVVSTEMKEEK
jgi:hypothetical protein